MLELWKPDGAFEAVERYLAERLTDGLVACLKDKGGLHTRADFETATGEYVTPISTEFRGRTVYECPPNGQGIIALMIMKILERFTPSAVRSNSLRPRPSACSASSSRSEAADGFRPCSSSGWSRETRGR